MDPLQRQVLEVGGALLQQMGISKKASATKGSETTTLFFEWIVSFSLSLSLPLSLSTCICNLDLPLCM